MSDAKQLRQIFDKHEHRIRDAIVIMKKTYKTSRDENLRTAIGYAEDLSQQVGVFAQSVEKFIVAGAQTDKLSATQFLAENNIKKIKECVQALFVSSTITMHLASSIQSSIQSSIKKILIDTRETIMVFFSAEDDMRNILTNTVMPAVKKQCGAKGYDWEKIYSPAVAAAQKAMEENYDTNPDTLYYDTNPNTLYYGTKPDTRYYGTKPNTLLDTVRTEQSAEQNVLDAASKLKAIKGKGGTDAFAEILAFGDKTEAVVNEQKSYVAIMQKIMQELAGIINTQHPDEHAYNTTDPLDQKVQTLIEQYKEQLLTVTAWVQKIQKELDRFQKIGSKFYQTHKNDPLMGEISKAVDPCFYYVAGILDMLNGAIYVVQQFATKVGVDLSSLRDAHQEQVAKNTPPEPDFEPDFIDHKQGGDMVLDQFTRGEITKEQLANRMKEFAQRHPNVIRTITTITTVNGLNSK